MKRLFSAVFDGSPTISSQVKVDKIDKFNLFLFYNFVYFDKKGGNEGTKCQHKIIFSDS
jgi:hypothetical protein